MKKNSHINLLGGKAHFSKEPLWFRLVVMLLMAGFWLTILLVLSTKFNSWVPLTGLSIPGISNLIRRTK